MNIFRRSTLGLLLLATFTLGCAGGEEYAEQTAASPDAASVQGGAPATAPGAQADTTSGAAAPAARMIIRTGQATVRVDDLEPAMEQVRGMAQALGGYVANSSVQSGDEEAKMGTMELKIPAARFDQAVSRLSPVGTLQSMQVDAQDVGQEYVDVAARMANNRRLEERLLALLETRTGRLEDVLKVEAELARVRGEIEGAEGRLRYLRSNVALSTLTVTLTEGGTPNPIGQAFGQSWRNFVQFIASFVGALGWLIPLLIAMAILWRFARWLFRNNPDGLAWPRGPSAPRPAGTPRTPAAPPAPDAPRPGPDTPPTA